jgi:hypothetical protein
MAWRVADPGDIYPESGIPKMFSSWIADSVSYIKKEGMQSKAYLLASCGYRVPVL